MNGGYKKHKESAKSATGLKMEMANVENGGKFMTTARRKYISN